MELADYVREVLDPTRLAVLGHAAAGPVDVDALAAALQVERRDILAVVARLQGAGLLDESSRLDRSKLIEIASSRAPVEPPTPSVLAGPWTDEERRILGRFFQGDRLVEIPANRSKRLIVLERLAQEFAPGVRYQEREVNFALQMFHADYAALRRYLVDEGMLTRADGVYWRSGGRFDDSWGESGLDPSASP